MTRLTDLHFIVCRQLLPYLVIAMLTSVYLVCQVALMLYRSKAPGGANVMYRSKAPDGAYCMFISRYMKQNKLPVHKWQPEALSLSVIVSWEGERTKRTDSERIRFWFRAFPAQSSEPQVLAPLLTSLLYHSDVMSDVIISYCVLGRNWTSTLKIWEHIMASISPILGAFEHCKISCVCSKIC